MAVNYVRLKPFNDSVKRTSTPDWISSGAGSNDFVRDAVAVEIQFEDFFKVARITEIRGLRDHGEMAVVAPADELF